ncbi:TIGR04076 family protein [Micromonospora sp. NPDC051196]|uniref:TIGR04076 family protein n=1 Tax=Micromonospora sp. NPDC051196 TaxID=3155281 RepID=UPI00341BDB9C
MSTDEPTTDEATTEVYDLRVVVERIEGRSVCGMKVGDQIDLTESCRLSIPAGQHFCMYALAACLPLLPAKQRALAEGDWMARDSHVACPDPEERVIMRIERTALRQIPTEELT